MSTELEAFIQQLRSGGSPTALGREVQRDLPLLRREADREDLPHPPNRAEVHGAGPIPARICIVGEAPGEREVVEGLPFVGPSGFELNGWLGANGVGRELCYVTNVVRVRPEGNEVERTAKSPGGFIDFRKTNPGPGWTRRGDAWISEEIRTGLQLLEAEIRACQPSLVICLGNLALWALTGKWGISKWRGSILQGCSAEGHKYKILPTLHPAAVLRQYEQRPTAVQDIKRGLAELEKGVEVIDPGYRFIIGPNFEQATATLFNILEALERGPLKLAVDIETRAGHISCIGFAWSNRDAICVPLMRASQPEGYWTLDEEAVIVHIIIQILAHKNLLCVGQNFIYDVQYTLRHWFVKPRRVRDTMITQHTMFSTSQKSLDYLASIYCDWYVYWKDEGKEWDPTVDENEDWEYNCKDTVNTYEIDEEQQHALGQMATGGWPQLPEIAAFQQALFYPVLRAMERGVRRDKKREAEFLHKVRALSDVKKQEIERMVGRSINVASPKQLAEFFYTELNQTEIRERRKPGSNQPGSLTTKDEALQILGARMPVLLPVTTRIAQIRSLKKSEEQAAMPVDPFDGRMRALYKVGGTETYRLACAESAFGSGGNLQNITSGDDDETDDSLPNIRELFIPDPGQVYFDLDLDSADLRIVVGESNCRGMQEIFDAGLKPYVEIAKEYYRDKTITKNHPSYRRMKALCHGTNYLGTPRGMAPKTGLLVKEVERVQNWYFGKFPEIKRWQDELKRQCDGRGYIENVFGYRYYIMGRRDHNIHNQAIAWKPQSTVGCLINRIWMELYERYEEGTSFVEVLLQVHDSLAGQFPAIYTEESVDTLKQASQIWLPYERPMLIPVGIKLSSSSWGACK